jgi:hypothetical protein
MFLDVAQSLQLLTTDLKPATDVHAPEPMATRTDHHRSLLLGIRVALSFRTSYLISVYAVYLHFSNIFQTGESDTILSLRASLEVRWDW